MIWVFSVRSIGSYRPSVSLCGQRRHWSDWADLSLPWAHRSFYRFCHAVAHIQTANTRISLRSSLSTWSSSDSLAIHRATRKALFFFFFFSFFFFFFFLFFWGGFTARQDYFAHFEPGQSLSEAKTRRSPRKTTWPPVRLCIIRMQTALMVRLIWIFAGRMSFLIP